MAKRTRKPKTGKITFEDCGGEGCIAKPRPESYKVDALIPGFSYTTGASPCGTDRMQCPVQLFFKSGQPYLRFCRTLPKGPFKRPVVTHVLDEETGTFKKRKRGKNEFNRKPGLPGFTIPVDSAAEARAVSAAACGCWTRSKDGFYETLQSLKKMKDGSIKRKLTKVWRGSFEKCPVSRGVLGDFIPRPGTRIVRR